MIRYLLLAGALLVTAPLAAAQAQTGTSASGNAGVRAQVLPEPGPARANLVEPRRDFPLVPAATSTRPLPAQGQNATRAALDERRTEILEKRALIMQRAEAAKAKARERFGAGVQQSVTNIIDRMSGAAERLVSIADRAEARILKLQASGTAMTESAALLATARTAITAAQDKVTGLSAALETALASEDPKAQMSSVRAAAGAAQESLMAAKKAVENVLKAIRIEGGAGANATITAEAQVQ